MPPTSFKSYPPVPMGVYCQPDYTGDVGPGTNYPIGMSLDQLMYVWWKIADVTIEGNGAMITLGDCPCIIRSPCDGIFTLDPAIHSGRSEGPVPMSSYICSGGTFNGLHIGKLDGYEEPCCTAPDVICYTITWAISLDATVKIGDTYYPSIGGSVSICNPDQKCVDNGSCTGSGSGTSSSFSFSSSSSMSSSSSSPLCPPPEFCGCVTASSLYDPSDPDLHIAGSFNFFDISTISLATTDTHLTLSAVLALRSYDENINA